MASSSSSLTSSNHKSFKYHVFLSFRGEDTRKTFVDHLYAALKHKGIHTFRDNEELEKGKRIHELFNAIEESRFLIIVFSKNYASSSWCLKEVTKIMECQDENQQIAFPVFYDVEPTDRNQRGPGKIAIAKHKTNQQIQKWEKAMERAGNLVGWDLKNIANGHEAEAIKIIVREISLKLRSIHLRNDENLIGMERRMQDLELSLGIDLNDKARTIGIWGMGGIGKTTLARAIFDKASLHFEGSSFVADVREVSKKKGLQSLQERVLLDVLKDEHTSLASVYDGERIMRMRLPYKKVLIVLDDVDDAKQLEALAGDWFKDGSRIIITTRDRKVLLEHGVNVNWIHDASLLSEEEAISLFSRYAFMSHIPDQGYEELSSDVVCYAAGLPLTIKVLGSHLRGEKVVFWRDVLKRLETIPWKKTLEVLEISYNGLEDDLKEIFLHVACFTAYRTKDVVIRNLESCGFRAIYGLTILEHKSLITTVKDKLDMHDRIQELGQNIVRRSHPHEPNKHSRLWIREEIEQLFSDDTGAEGSPCIGLELFLGWNKPSPKIIMKALGNMNKLRYLFLLGKCADSAPARDGKYDPTKQYFPNSLQFLCWDGYPFRSLPQTFLANNVVSLELSYSGIVQLWESNERKVLKKLRFLDLSHSKLRTLDLGMTPNLERLNLIGCHDLREVESVQGSICGLQHLRQLALSGKVSKDIDRLKCLEELGLSYIQIKYLPDSVCMLKHLKSLRLKYCPSLKELPENLGWLEHLEELSLTYLGVKRLPDSICMLKRLRFLEVKSCFYLKEVPKYLGQLECLEKLKLKKCTSLGEIPNNICKMQCLRYFILSGCSQVKKLSEELGSLKLLKELNIKGTRISYLQQSITSLEGGLCIVGYDAVGQPCFPESQSETSDTDESVENDHDRNFCFCMLTYFFTTVICRYWFGKQVA